jgi:transposase-like protein
MHIEATPEAILTQFGYVPSDNTLEQINRIIQNTAGFEKFSKHLFSLNDSLKHMNGFVALSNTNDYLKIKSEGDVSEAIMEEFHETVRHWAQKYKVLIEKVPEKETYYITGGGH